MHWHWLNEGTCKDNYELFFVIFQLSYGPWLMSELCFHLIFWEEIDGFWWNFVYAILWLTHKIFPNFSTELWPLIDVKISIFLCIFRNNEWILIKFRLCIGIPYNGIFSRRQIFAVLSQKHGDYFFADFNWKIISSLFRENHRMGGTMTFRR